MAQALITAAAAAALLGVRKQTVYLWARQGRVPYYRVGRLLKFDGEELLNSFRVEASQQTSPANEMRFDLRPLAEPFRAMTRQVQKEEMADLTSRYRDLPRMVK